MKMVVFKFVSGIDPIHLNIQGDCIDVRDGFVFVWSGECIVAMVRQEIVNMVCIREKKEVCISEKKEASNGG